MVVQVSGRPDRIVPIIEGFDLLGVIQGYRDIARKAGVQIIAAQPETHIVVQDVRLVLDGAGSATGEILYTTMPDRDLAKEAACGANADTPTRSTSASLAGSNEEPSPSSTTSDRAGSVVAPSTSLPLASRLEALADQYRHDAAMSLPDALSRAATLGAEEARGLLRDAGWLIRDIGHALGPASDSDSPILGILRRACARRANAINEFLGSPAIREGEVTPDLKSDTQAPEGDHGNRSAEPGSPFSSTAVSTPEPAPGGVSVFPRPGLNSEEGERRREYGSETLPRVADPKRSIGNDTGLVGEESSMQSAGSATAPSHLSSEHADLSLTEEERTNLICAYLNGYYGTVERAVAAIMFPRGRRIADLEADLRECAEAMKPFAKEAEGWPSTLKDSVRMPSRSMGDADPEGETEFTLGDLRRLAALAERIGKGNA